MEGVLTVCDFHVWKISKDHDMLTAHLVIDEEKDAPAILLECKSIARKHGFKHLTIQTELVPCNDSDPEFRL